MTIEFSYTFEDLKEAYAAHQPKPHKDWRRWPTILLVALVAGYMALIMWAHIGYTGNRRPALLDLTMPVIAFVLFLAPWLAYRAIQAAGWKRAWRSRGFVGTIGWIVFFLLLLLLWRQLKTLPPPTGTGNDATPPESQMSIGDVLLPHATWLVLLAALTLLLIRQATGQLRMIWNGSPGLQRRYTMLASDDGIIFAEPLARHELKWFAFDRVIETQNLYLLYISDHSFHMVPKRAFADVNQSDEFRAIIENRITRRPTAFPVLPVAG